jgi:hypothetical protein
VAQKGLPELGPPEFRFLLVAGCALSPEPDAAKAEAYFQRALDVSSKQNLGSCAPP